MCRDFFSPQWRGSQRVLTYYMDKKIAYSLAKRWDDHMFRGSASRRNAAELD